jgi:hypothetical protein
LTTNLTNHTNVLTGAALDLFVRFVRFVVK